MVKCSRCIREAKWRLPDTFKVYCYKHVPKKKTVVPLMQDPNQRLLT